MIIPDENYEFPKKKVSKTEFKADRFPKETSEGKIEIIDNKIICSGKDSRYSCTVHIDDLQYAYIIVNKYKEVLLFLFDFHQNYLPTNFSGFSEVYTELSEKLGFDNQTFFDNVNTQVETKKEIWRKQHPSNFKILEDQNTDYALGFEILSPEKDFIHWDTTYKELQENPNVYFEKSPYDQKIAKFRYPIRIGNLILEDFRAYFDHGRTDVAVLHFYSHCMDATNSGKSYDEIKERFCKDFLPENQCLKYEREDQNSMSFNARDLIISLVYTYDSEWQFDGGYTSLSVKNQREYPDLLVDTDYESNLEISAILELPIKVSVSGDYKRNKSVKRRPEKLESDTPVIWMDHKNSKIGFADLTYCQTFEQAEIKNFTIQNILPAKGGGRAYLEVNFVADSRSYAILSGACNAFDAFVTQLQKLTGLEVGMASEYHDV